MHALLEASIDRQMLIKTQEGESGKAQSGVRNACVEPR